MLGERRNIVNKKHFADPFSFCMVIFTVALIAVCFFAFFFIFHEHITSDPLWLVLYIAIAFVILSFLALPLAASKKVLIGEVGIQIFCRKNEKVLEWDSICKAEVTSGGRGCVMAHFFVNTEIGLDVTVLEITTYLLRSVRQYAPDRIKEMLAAELSRYKIAF